MCKMEIFTFLFRQVCARAGDHSPRNARNSRNERDVVVMERDCLHGEARGSRRRRVPWHRSTIQPEKVTGAQPTKLSEYDALMAMLQRRGAPAMTGVR